MTIRDIQSTDAPQIINDVLHAAVAGRASDLHLEPAADDMKLLFRIDGLLEQMAQVDEALGRSLVQRLMVLAQLLTYRQDVPQEGRFSYEHQADDKAGGDGRRLDLRLSVMPTNHGLRAVVRLPAELTQPRRLDQLQLPAATFNGLCKFAAADAGMLALVGPAGAGKTTTIYALLEHIAAQSPGLSLISLEDPVERDLPGVTQIQVTPFGELSYERALRSLLRQDPQVLMLGEIRDAATASIAVQAALSGHRLICTMHAGSPGAAIARLLEMGVEPYQVCSALFGIVAQRLLRKLVDGEYRGRVPAAEFAIIDPPLRQTILTRADAAAIDQTLRNRPGHVSLRQSADELVGRGITDAEELARVLGAATSL